MTTRLHFVKKARKAYRADGIKKGDSYYWWKFAYGPKIRSKDEPRRSQLTQSEFIGAMLDFEDTYDALLANPDPESLVDELKSLADEVRSYGDEQRDKAQNVEQAFENGSPVIDLLNERGDACDTIADELDGAASDAESAVEEWESEQEGEDEEDKDPFTFEANVDWSYE